jgi:hypothetical protein
MNLSNLPDDWRDHYEERAAFLEYCEGLERKSAERLAFVQIVRRMKAENTP